MPLVFRIHTQTSIPLEVDSLRLEVMRTQTPDDVRRTKIYRGNREPECGEFFDVSGSAADDNTVVWEGDCGKVKLIGAHLSSGQVLVDGHAGMHLGAEMRGGEITVRGNAADWVGAEMKGGRITVEGDAGHLVGSVYRGGSKGMTGGEIFIHGSVGNEIGHSMRRGLIAVGGRAGDVAGVGMIAGSIFIFGETGIRYGAGMKRGTIALLSPNHTPEILPTFKFAGIDRPLFLPLYLKHLQAAGMQVPEECLTRRYGCYRGDFLELGKGEIFLSSV